MCVCVCVRGYWQFGRGVPTCIPPEGMFIWGSGVWRYVCDNRAFSSGTALEPGKSATNNICTAPSAEWFDEREACTKKIERRWCHAPKTHYLSKPRGFVAGEGSHTRTGPGRPLGPPEQQ